MEVNSIAGNGQRLTSKDGLKMLLEGVFNASRSPSDGPERTRVRAAILSTMQAAADGLPSIFAGRVTNSTINFNAAVFICLTFVISLPTDLKK